MAKTKKPFESVSGRYTPMPDLLVDSAAFMGASHRTRSLTIEIEAEVPDGVPDNVVRTVTENSRTLKFTSHGFEKE